MALGPILLDATEITGLAGDPTSPEYEKNLPDFKSPHVVGLGIVDGPVQGLPNGIVIFPVRLSEFIRGTRLESVILCVHSLPHGFSSSHLVIAAADKIKVPTTGKTFQCQPLVALFKYVETLSMLSCLGRSSLTSNQPFFALRRGTNLLPNRE
jgi:hypothetical protein